MEVNIILISSPFTAGICSLAPFYKQMKYKKKSFKMNRRYTQVCEKKEEQYFDFY